MERPKILLATTGDTDSYREALVRAGFQPVVAGEAQSVDLAVIDCDLDTDVLAELASSLDGEPRTPALLLLGAKSDVPSGVGSGSDEIALKPLPADALVYRLQALLIRTGRQFASDGTGWTDHDPASVTSIGEGHVVSVFAPKGGVGKTTIAVNVAVALRQQTRSEVLLFDADVGVGNVSSVLDVPYRLGLADLADSAPEEWTDAAFDQATTAHAETGVRVLTWGTDPAQSERVTVDLLLAALRWARAHHSYVVVDNHPGYDDRTMAMLAVANEIFLVVTPEVGAVKNSSQFLELARELGLGSVVRVIVNRANHGIRTQDIATSLGLPVAATVDSNGPKAVIASNEGKPLVTKFPREKISDDLHGVARLITNPEGAAGTAKARGHWWARLGARPTGA